MTQPATFFADELEDGARAATCRMASMVSRGTGVGRKARMDRREVMAASTAAVVSGVMGMVRR